VGPLQLYEDQAFLAKFYLEHKMYFSDKIWLDYRVHDESCTAEATRSCSDQQARYHYLTWLRKYLEQGCYKADRRIQRAVTRALLPHRYKYAAQILRAVKRIVRRLKPA
jgi:hypothetical protein